MTEVKTKRPKVYTINEMSQEKLDDIWRDKFAEQILNIKGS